MGIREFVAGLLGSSESADESREGGAASGEQQGPSVDIERRASAIAAQYGLDASTARGITERLAAARDREDGYSRTMLVDQFTRELDLDEELARTVVDTEVASLRRLETISALEGKNSREVRVRWVDPVGRDDSPVCAAVRDRVDEEGAVTPEELREVLRGAATGHESGTPERAEDLIPHTGCSHTVVRHVES
jgi:hypothetical protein